MTIPSAHPAVRTTAHCRPLAVTPVLPRLHLFDAGRHFIDFGRAAFAALELTLAADAPAILTVHLGERLESPGRIHRSPGGSIRYLQTALTLRPGRHTYRIVLPERDARMMPADIGPVMPFRYVEIEDFPQTMADADIRQFTVHYPFNDAAASFRSADPVLNDVWELCRYSIKATSFCGIYVDGDRERIPYEADAYINQLGHYCCDAEYQLARYTHEYLIQRPTWPTEWIMQSVMMAWMDYLYTGERQSLEAFYDDLKAKTLVGLRRPDHLISTLDPPSPKAVLAAIHHDNIRDIVDWPLGERDHYDLQPVNTVVNAFHAHACNLMQAIATALGHSADAQHFAHLAYQTQQAINAHLVDAKTSLYLDAPNSKHSSLHANMFPLAFGLVPADRVERVADFVASRGMACSVYGAQFLMEALYRAGRPQHALNLLTSIGERGWAHMLEVGSTITLEAWDDRFKPNQDWNHAWGAAPANVIPRLLMGLTPMEPGFARVNIHPQLASLPWAQLTHPTPRGPIHLRIEQTREAWNMSVELPAGVSAQFIRPAHLDPASLTLDGRPATAPHTLSMDAGPHQISARPGRPI